MLLCMQAPVQADTKPLRHLVFKVGVTRATTEAVQSFGADSGTLAAQITAHGEITADIIAFTPDNAFRIEISEALETRPSPKIQVDVTPEGIVRVKPDDLLNLSEEAQLLVRTLARNFITPADLNAGRWSKSQKQGHNSVDEEYQVKSASNNGDLTIELNQHIIVQDGAEPYDTSGFAKITYSARFSVPKDISMYTITRKSGITGGASREIRIQCDLVSDSFQR